MYSTQRREGYVGFYSADFPYRFIFFRMGSSLREDSVTPVFLSEVFDKPETFPDLTWVPVGAPLESTFLNQISGLRFLTIPVKPHLGEGPFSPEGSLKLRHHFLSEPEARPAVGGAEHHQLVSFPLKICFFFLICPTVAALFGPIHGFYTT